MAVLDIIGLDKSYGPVHAVKNLHLQVEKGQVYGILGPNGSGKTTTLAMVLGIVLTDGGTFKWFGKDSDHRARQQIGALLESPNFYPYLNLSKNLAIICEIKELPKTEIPRVLELVGLAERSHSKFQTLSYGMKQRLALASVLLGDPEVLVLDEPANGLDPEGIAEVRKIIIREAEKGKTIIMASHILDEVEKVCSHVAILRKGVLIASGEVGQLLKGEQVIILASETLDLLKKFLDSWEGVHKCYAKLDHFQVVLKEAFSSTHLNKALMEHGVVLSKMEIQKQSLEEQFLELVKESAK